MFVVIVNWKVREICDLNLQTEPQSCKFAFSFQFISLIHFVVAFVLVKTNCRTHNLTYNITFNILVLSELKLSKEVFSRNWIVMCWIVYICVSHITIKKVKKWDTFCRFCLTFTSLTSKFQFCRQRSFFVASNWIELTFFIVNNNTTLVLLSWYQLSIFSIVRWQILASLFVTIAVLLPTFVYFGNEKKHETSSFKFASVSK